MTNTPTSTPTPTKSDSAATNKSDGKENTSTPTSTLVSTQNSTATSTQNSIAKPKESKEPKEQPKEPNRRIKKRTVDIKRTVKVPAQSMVTLDGTQSDGEGDDEVSVEKIQFGQVIDIPDLDTGAVKEYMICEPLGEGGYSEVLLANDLSKEEKYVAAKCVNLTSSKVSRLGKQVFTEVDLLKKLRHQPGIITLLGYKIIDKKAIFMIMELAHESLSNIIISKREANKEVVQEFALNYWRQAVQCVHTIHKQNIIHCDIKPDNFVLIEKSNALKLIDFGCATEMSPLTEAVVRKKTLGTTRYMSPEYLKYRLASKGLDIWALGVVLHHLLVGRTPFKGTRTEAKMAIAEKNVDLTDIKDEHMKKMLKAIFIHDRDNRPSCGKILKSLGIPVPMKKSEDNTSTTDRA